MELIILKSTLLWLTLQFLLSYSLSPWEVRGGFTWFPPPPSFKGSVTFLWFLAHWQLIFYSTRFLPYWQRLIADFNLRPHKKSYNPYPKILRPRASLPQAVKNE